MLNELLTFAVKQRLEPPQFLEPPQSVEILEASSASLVCTARGHPIPNMKWYKDEKVVSDTEYITLCEEDVGNLTKKSEMILTNASIPIHDGKYTVEASSEAGSVVHDVNVTGM